MGKGGGGRQAVEDNKECLKYGEKFHLRKARPPATRCCALNFYHLPYSDFREKAMNERDLACVLSKGINLNRISISADLLICFPSLSPSTQEVNSNYLAGGGGVEGGVTCTVRGVHPISHPSSANC